MQNSESFTIKSDFLKVEITKKGAEICSIQNNEGDEYMWNANPDIWSSYAPVLFPIIGGLTNGKYTFEGIEYIMPKHGFVRNNDNLNVAHHTDNSITFQYRYTEETLKIYPFKFEFNITFSVDGPVITINHKIINIGENTMYFSLGGHPAFKCPLTDYENYEDYFLKFEKKENCNTYLLNNEGLLSGETRPLFNKSDTLFLEHSLFNKDALILKDLKSRNVSLSHKTKGPVLSVTFNDFEYLGIWAKPDGDFICIEPWLGVTDNENTDSDFKTKEGILALNPNTDFKASYSITIH